MLFPGDLDPILQSKKPSETSARSKAKSHLVRPLPLGQLFLTSPGLLRYLGFPTFLPVPAMNVLHRAEAPLQMCEGPGCDTAFGCRRKSSA